MKANMTENRNAQIGEEFLLLRVQCDGIRAKADCYTRFRAKVGRMMNLGIIRKKQKVVLIM